MAAATTTTPDHSAEGGRMTLVEHLRELRGRVFKSVLAIVATTVLAWFFYPELLGLLKQPFVTALDMTSKELEAKLVQGTIAGPFILQMKICGIAGVVLASPVWLYQLWAFVMPGLHKHERKWTLIFSAVAGPLFIAGVVLGYLVLPKGIQMLLSFTGADIANFVDVGLYLSFAIRMLIAFGIAFEIPLFVVLLNLAGVVSARTLARSRRWIILVAFVFAAVATPSADPFSMLALAIPLTILFLVSEMIAHLIDRRRARRAGFAGVGDDEISELDYVRDADDDTTSQIGFRHDSDDDRPSSLDDPD
jgi:sec-independent protein translocase protein TatC